MTLESDLKKTPLYDRHIAFGGKMIDFGGWSLPVQYTGIIEEHQAVRQKAGLFDVSHMGEIEVKGTGARSFLDWLLSADLSRLTLERAVYSPMCYPDGGTVDDLLVYQLGAERFLLVVNAGCKDKDAAWIREQAAAWNEGACGSSGSAGKVDVRDRSDEYAQIALQGPDAARIIAQFSHLAPALSLKYYHHTTLDMCHGVPAIVSRTGYTGEDGFEFYCSPDAGVALFDWLAAAGATPCGLGARDSLRFEASMPLYGHELSPTITPADAGLSRFVAIGRKTFIGSEALNARSARHLIGVRMSGRAIPRAEYPVHQNGQPVGIVTSGMFAPTLGHGYAMVLTEPGFDPAAGPLSVLVRGREEPADLVPMPFYKREKK